MSLDKSFPKGTIEINKGISQMQYLFTKSQNKSLQIKSMPLAPQQEQMHKSEQEGEMTG